MASLPARSPLVVEAVEAGQRVLAVARLPPLAAAVQNNGYPEAAAAARAVGNS